MKSIQTKHLLKYNIDTMYAYLFKANYYKRGTWNSHVHRLSWTKQKYQNSVLHLILALRDLYPPTPLYCVSSSTTDQDQYLEGLKAKDRFVADAVQDRVNNMAHV